MRESEDDVRERGRSENPQTGEETSCAMGNDAASRPTVVAVALRFTA